MGSGVRETSCAIGWAFNDFGSRGYVLRAANAFRYLGSVTPQAFHGERPVTVEWVLTTPLRPEWVRRWSNVA
jgi:hypothetical protein